MQIALLYTKHFFLCYNTNMHKLSFLQLRNPKDDETPIESATQIFASILASSYIPTWKWPFAKPKSVAFELFLIDQIVSFYITAPVESEMFLRSLLASSYPQSHLTDTDDPMQEVFKSKHIAVGEITLNSSYYLPTKTYMDFKDIDPLSSLVGFLSKQPQGIKMAV